MRRAVVTFCLLSLAACCIFAQPDPNGNQPADNRRQPAQGNRNAGPLMANIIRLAGEQRTALLRTPQGLFVLRNGMLAKLHPISLEQQGELLDLFEVQAVPAGGRRAAAKAPEQEITLARLLPASVLAEGGDLLILIGDRFFRVNAETMEVKVRTELLVPGRPAQPQADRLATLTAPVTLDRDPQTAFLYVARAAQLMIVNVDTGQLMAQVQLPPQMMPPKPDPVKRGPGDGNAAPAEVTVIGQLVRQGWQNNPTWAVKDEKGDEYLLRGPQLAQLLKTPNLEGKRVRINGTLETQPGEGDAAGQKALTVKSFQVLP